MNKINSGILRKSQLKMLEILIEVDKICKKNGIKYWLDSGTLLGAVRHKGFIPWDDDIDICMLETDYNHFLKVAMKDLDSNKYFLSNKCTDKNVLFNYSKIRDRNSIFIENEETDHELYHQGIFIDIFCMSYIKNYNLLTKKIYTILLKLKDLIPERGKNRWCKKLMKRIGICKLANYMYEKYFYSRVNEGIIGYKYSFVNTHQIEVIFPLETIIFEKYKFLCPNNSHLYLSKLYGDYMQLPQEKDRIWHAKYISLNEKCYFEKVIKK